MPSVKVALDNLPKDAEVEVPYLGLFKNNTTTDVDQDAWDRYQANWPGATEGDSLEVSTAAAEKASNDHEKLRLALEEGDIEDLNKGQVEKLAGTAGVETKGKTKDELVKEVKKSTSNPEG